MNDFTKGQLQEIYRCIEYMSNDFNLVDKVEYMIDSYCDHKKKSCMECGCYSCVEDCDDNQ
jgi:hypothetical protein